TEKAEELKNTVSDIKENRLRLEDAFRKAEGDLKKLLLKIPNVPHESVIKGAGEDENEVYKAHEGDLPHLPEGALPHWELADKYPLFDLEIGAMLGGSGFPLFLGKGAQLQRALVQYFLDQGREAGF